MDIWGEKIAEDLKDEERLAKMSTHVQSWQMVDALHSLINLQSKASQQAQWQDERAGLKSPWHCCTC